MGRIYTLQRNEAYSRLSYIGYTAAGPEGNTAKGIQPRVYSQGYTAGYTAGYTGVYSTADQKGIQKVYSRIPD